jgi:hypothetical protein
MPFALQTVDAVHAPNGCRASTRWSASLSGERYPSLSCEI